MDVVAMEWCVKAEQAEGSEDGGETHFALGWVIRLVENEREF